MTQPPNSLKTLRTYLDTEGKTGQDVASEDLGMEVGGGKKLTALSQALNQAYNGQGKTSGHHVVDGEKRQVFHASAGRMGSGQSVTLFYYPLNPIDGFHLVALGEHVSKASYKIDKELGQERGHPFGKNSTVGPSG
ncbi:hypothetical protein ACFVZM_09025 [Streptomyces sioyaensis]|uniref:hypothetical protein n=1 Tax=Streptomyces sioyaensis TaxID=67364 RepID=UPI0036780342